MTLSDFSIRLPAKSKRFSVLPGSIRQSQLRAALRQTSVMCVWWSVILRTCYESDSAQSVSRTGRLCTLGAAPDRTCSPALGAQAQEIHGGVRIQRLRKDQRRRLQAVCTDSSHALLRHKTYGPPRHSRHILSLQTQKRQPTGPSTHLLSVQTWERAFNVRRVNVALAHQRSPRFESRSCLGLDGEASLQDADS